MRLPRILLRPDELRSHLDACVGCRTAFTEEKQLFAAIDSGCARRLTPRCQLLCFPGADSIEEKPTARHFVDSGQCGDCGCCCGRPHHSVRSRRYARRRSAISDADRCRQRVACGDTSRRKPCAKRTETVRNGEFDAQLIMLANCQGPRDRGGKGEVMSHRTKRGMRRCSQIGSKTKRMERFCSL